MKYRLRQELFELAAVLVTVILYFIFFEVLQQKLLFIAIAAAFWIGHVVRRARRERGLLRAWGFRSDNLREAFVAATIAFVLGLGLIVLAALWLGNRLWSPYLPFVLALYPLWGLMQQFLLQALVARNLDRFVSRPLAVLIASLLFGAIHLPDPGLAGLTFALALIFVPLYLRRPNLLPLGLYHGWLAAFAYLGVVGKDPWAEVMLVLSR